VNFFVRVCLAKTQKAPGGRGLHFYRQNHFG
jgi:hypothetical protein